MLRAATADDNENVRGRLAALGFPFGPPEPSKAAWARQLVLAGTLERNAITEKLMAGEPIAGIAAKAGITEARVYHYLGLRAGHETSPDGWGETDTGDEAP